jgi:hypothetical protein
LQYKPILSSFSFSCTHAKNSILECRFHKSYAVSSENEIETNQVESSLKIDWF